MLAFNDTLLSQLSVHYVGNQVQEEGFTISDQSLILDDSIRELLKKYFTKFFKDQPFQQFFHDSDLPLNECYIYAKDIFSDPETLHFNSIKLAKHLFSCSDHPNIKSGEFYVVYFENVYVGDEVCDAIGLFKSENKETFIKVFPENNHFKIEGETGINVNKLDKGCMILNLDAESGFKVIAIDQTNGNNEARYWSDKFLNTQPLKDNYFHTQQYMMMCKEFAMDAFPGSSKSDKLCLAKDTERFFKEEDLFDKVSYHEKVLREPEIIEAFEDYKSSYQQERDVSILDEFDVSPAAVKKLKHVFKSVIKLDKNFHIYIHGNRDLIRNGYDEELGMKFYQVFYKEES